MFKRKKVDRSKKGVRTRVYRARFYTRRGFLGYLVIMIMVVGLIVWLKFSTNYWTGEDKLTLAINNSDGGVNVVTFNPIDSEIVNIYIPGNTQVEVTHQLGVWKIKSLWQLGKQEGLRGNLLTSTVTRNFKFPVYLWSGEFALGLTNTSLASLLRGIFGFYETNLGMGDRVRLAFFSLGIKNSKRVDVDLSQTSYLKKTVLKDGEEGYVVSGNIPQKLAATFSDNEFSQSMPRIMIRDRSDNPGEVEEVGKIVEILGGKVSSISRESGEDVVCKVAGKDKSFIETILRLFPCQEERRANLNFDLEMTIGRDFQKNF